MVYVIAKSGKPLMPCKEAKARHLLRDGKARVVRREPFTIQLLYDCQEKTQDVVLGVDAGSKYIGLSASTEKQELYASEVELRTDITNLLSTRKQLRKSRRNRKTRYRKARFLNRVRTKKKGWLPPSIINRIDAHIKVIENVMKILPITKVIIETASFDIQKLKNPDISGDEYQKGDQLGFYNLREYILFRDEYKCQHCKGKSGDKVLNVHHLESRKTGGNSPSNLITLCTTCHNAYHDGKIKLKQKRGKSFKAEAFMGIMRKTFFMKFKELYPNIEVENTYGYLTKNTRIKLGLPKYHHIDAFCIAGNLNAKRLDHWWYQKQTRKHNRQIHKLTILKGGIRKRNQSPYEVFGFRLFDKVKCDNGEVGFIVARRLSGYFNIRKLDGTKISQNLSYKKLKLMSKRKCYIQERK